MPEPSNLRFLAFPGAQKPFIYKFIFKFFGFWRARNLKFKLLGPLGVAKTFKSTLAGPPWSPESLDISLYLSFLGFWRARKLKFKFLGSLGEARKLKFMFLGHPGGPKPSNLCFLALPGAQKA